MAFKNIIKKSVDYLLRPRGIVNINISQINHGEILRQKCIVITGGGSGIGYYMAKKFISEGATVLIVGRNEEKLRKAKEEMGLKCQYLKFDVTQVEKAKQFIIKAISILGKIDCLVCNAGISLHEGTINHVSIESFDKQMNVNLRANYFLVQAFIEQHKNGIPQDILLITSMTGNQINEIPYGIAKAGLNSMIQKINKRYYQYGIRVNAIAPGVIPTELTKSYIDTSDGNMFYSESSGRYFLPEEIAEVATFLLSDASKIIAGEVITCDGGISQKPIWK